MAVWQYELTLVPTEVLAAERVGDRVAPEVLGGLWLRGRERVGVEEGVGALLPLTRRVDELQSFGIEEEHDAVVALEEGRVVEVSFRLDLRQAWLGMLGGICELARRLDCSLVDADGRVLPPVTSVVEAEIQASRPAAFVRDPHGFLRRLAEKMDPLQEGESST